MKKLDTYRKKSIYGCIYFLNSFFLRMEEPREIGDWTRISVLGSGGFGVVVLWRSKHNELIAVKKCKLKIPSSLTTKQKERWRHEVLIMKELNHPNIIRYKPLPPDFEELLNKYNPSRLPLLPMEYCQKGNLRHILTLPKNLKGLKEETCRDVLSDICSAVAYLHDRHITHRDIKPDNIVLDESLERKHGVIYKLIDLGYAKELGDSTVSFVGTLYYLAPEILSNKRYDCSVDYWSMGILAFEIMCGVLPFPSNLSFVERFRKLKNKGPNDICLLRSSTGELVYSDKLPEENHVTTCFRSHMEAWLRVALQFDPKLRSTPFRNKTNIFDGLNAILQKKIVNVFSVYFYEFFSYEFDEYTSIRTLKQWIEKDTKIGEKDQLLLGHVNFSNWDEKSLLVDCLAEDKNELYLFKRTELFGKKKQTLPHSIKTMLEDVLKTFMWSQVKSIYASAISYILRDLDHALAFSHSMDLYLNYLKMLVTHVQKSGDATREKLKLLMGVVNATNAVIKKTKCGIDLKLLELFSSVERCVKNEHHLAVYIAKWTEKMDVIKDMYSQMDVIKLPQLNDLLKKSIQQLQFTAEKTEIDEGLKITGISKIVSDTMKIKYKMLEDKNLLEFVTYLNKASRHLESLLSWIRCFDSHMDNLKNSFEIISQNCIPKTAEVDVKAHHSFVHAFDPQIETALKKTEKLQSRLDEDLNIGIEEFKRFCDDVGAYLSETLLEAPL